MAMWRRAAEVMPALVRQHLLSTPRLGSLGSRALATVRAAAVQTDTPERVCLVQGASRGLGLEFTKQLLARPNNQVIATCRSPQTAQQLQDLQQQHADRLRVVQLDVTDEQSIERAAAEVSSSHRHLDLLINAAGLLHVPGEVAPETALARLEAKNLMLLYQTNAAGPILVCKAFVPLLAKTAAATGANKDRPAVIANMSARVGSIGDNSLGGWHSYRASKTALNQLTRCLAVELGRRKQAVAAILLHPGTCDTDLSKPFQKNVPPGKLFPRDRAVQQLLKIIDSTTLDQNGQFFAWDGQQIPW